MIDKGNFTPSISKNETDVVILGVALYRKVIDKELIIRGITELRLERFFGSFQDLHGSVCNGNRYDLQVSALRGEFSCCNPLAVRRPAGRVKFMVFAAVKGAISRTICPNDAKIIGAVLIRP